MNDDVTGGVIELSDGDEEEEEDECKLAQIDSQVCEIQRKIDKLVQRKEDLLAEKNLLLDRAKDRKRRQTSREIASQRKLIPAPELEGKLHDAAKMFDIDSFRPLQMDTMLTTLRNEDCILVMPTGGGKSLTFQLPALVGTGVTVVVSPLISLMEDQVSGLEKLGMAAAMITANTPQDTQSSIQRDMSEPGAALKLVYVTPEKIAKAKRFQNAMEKSYERGLLARVVIDEVHCVSQWGHDFRPDYKYLGNLKRQYPRTPILGLTATATERVLTDVQSVLQLPHCRVLRAGFNRPNLYYEVLQKAGGPALVAEQISGLIKGRFAKQSGLIYCLTRGDCELVMANLTKYNLKVAYYHAALDMAERKKVHHQWLRNEIQAIVATIAFGMGIDKRDVRFIIHHTMSKSVENYYQESGRAGRDGAPAQCVLLFQPSDFFKVTTMTCSDRGGVSRSYEMLGYVLATSCRRLALASYFGEHFDPKECGKQCDTCKGEVSYISQDITAQAKEILELLDNKSKDLTFAMLLADWRSKRKSASRKLSPSTLEAVIIQLLRDNVLEEKFKAGMYKALSYCVHGGHARAVLSGARSVTLQIPAAIAPQFASAIPQPASGANSTGKVTSTSSAAPTHSVLARPTSAPAKKKRKAAIVFDSDESE